MNVYVVSEGERGEGHSPIAVYANHGLALAAVAVRAPGVELASEGGGSWRGVRANRVDEIWVHRFVVRGEVA